MKLVIHLIQSLLVVTLLIVAGCSVNNSTPETVKGSGSVTTETRTIASFTGIDLRGTGDITLQQGTSPALVITAEANLLPYLTSDVSGGTLILAQRDNANLELTQPIIFEITYPGELTNLNISGAGTIHADDLTTGRLNVRLSGTGNIVLTGAAPDLRFELTGMGGFDGREFANQNATIRISGTGTVIVNATQTLDVKLDGMGSVSYLGSPEITEDVSGAGSILPLQ